MNWMSVNRILGGAFLVSGTCIGAGMLGLPISTAAGGFLPSAVAFLICWVMMTLSAFLMLEISLCYPQETNLITMARSTLGKGGAWVAWGCYLLFLYSLMGAYTSGASDIFGKVLSFASVPEAFSLPSVVSFFALVVFLGTRWVDGVNRVMMVGLIVAYLLLILIVVPKVQFSAMEAGDSKYLWMAGPLLVTSFGFHLLIPSLKNYLQSNIRELRWSILLGSLLPLFVYLFWEFIILGSVPAYGENGLIAMNHASQPVVMLTQALSVSVQNQWVTLTARIFGFCAILTSFIGVALGLFDFLADGLHIRKNLRGRVLLAALTFLPPAVFVLLYPAGFMLALRYAGIFAAILLVLYPALMVWRKRYHQIRQANSYEMFGGKIALVAVLIFGCIVIVLEIMQEMHWLPVPTA